MALQKCKECGNEVSTEASNCPKCGAPVKKTKPKTSGCLVLFIVLIAFVIYANTRESNTDTPTTKHQNLKQEQSEPKEKELSDTLEKKSNEAPAHLNWNTGTVKDEMTDANRPYAANVSLNGADFKFPYHVDGGSKASIVIRKDAGKKVAYILIEKGHMICDYNNCHIVIRGDSGTMKNWSTSKAAPGVHNALFIDNVTAFEKFIKKNKKIRIGIEFYEYGIKSFDFDTSEYPGI